MKIISGFLVLLVSVQPLLAATTSSSCTKNDINIVQKNIYTLKNIINNIDSALEVKPAKNLSRKELQKVSEYNRWIKEWRGNFTELLDVSNQYLKQCNSGTLNITPPALPGSNTSDSRIDYEKLNMVNDMSEGALMFRSLTETQKNQMESENKTYQKQKQLFPTKYDKITRTLR